MGATMNCRAFAAVPLVCFLIAAPAIAKKKHSAPKSSPPDAALQAYIARVRAENAAEVRTPGCIWTDEGMLTRLNTDVKANHRNDPVSVVVVEALSAATDGTVKNSRSSNANSQVAALLGRISGSSALSNL